MPNHAGVLQSRFFPAKLEAEGDDAIFNTLLVEAGILDFDHRLNPDFMWFDVELGKADVRGEVFTAHRILDGLALRKQAEASDDQAVKLAA